MNRDQLAQRLIALRDDVPSEGLRGAICDLLVDVIEAWHEVPAVLELGDDGEAVVPALVRAWKVEARYGARDGGSTAQTLVYFRSLDLPLVIFGDHHDALVKALKGGK